MSHGTGQRQLKSQGSCKSGNVCPAAIFVVESAAGFSVTYYSTHFGHEQDLAHLPLQKEEKALISGILNSRLLS